LSAPSLPPLSFPLYQGSIHLHHTFLFFTLSTHTTTLMSMYHSITHQYLN
jgi:hypothetical protein